MSKIYFKNLVIEHIVKPSLKNSSITVKSADQIILKTPHVSSGYVENLLHVKFGWIEKQLHKLQIHKPKEVNLKNEVLLFGEIYSIDAHEATILREKIQKLHSVKQEKILKCYDDFYKEYAKRYLPLLIQKYAVLMNVAYSELKFRKMSRRWGSCSATGVITLNTKLMQLKEEFIVYVVVHELAHLVHMNHSKKFHQLVDRYLPDSKKLRNELKNIHIQGV